MQVFQPRWLRNRGLNTRILRLSSNTAPTHPSQGLRWGSSPRRGRLRRIQWCTRAATTIPRSTGANVPRSSRRSSSTGTGQEGFVLQRLKPHGDSGAQLIQIQSEIGKVLRSNDLNLPQKNGGALAVAALEMNERRPPESIPAVHAGRDRPSHATALRARRAPHQDAALKSSTPR